MKDQAERQRGFDGNLGVLQLPGALADAHGLPRGDRFGVNHRVTSPRWTSARSYAGQFPTRYFVLYLGCTLDFTSRSCPFGRHDGQGRDEHLLPRTNAASMGPGRSRAQRVSRSWSVRAWRASRSRGGACTTICFSVFIAVVRAFTAESRATLSWRIISTAPSAVLGIAVDWPANTDRAATSASTVSDLPAARRVRRVAPIDFHDTMPRSTHRTRQAGAIAAGAFDAERLEPPVCLGPRDQGLVAPRIGHERLVAETDPPGVDRHRDVDMLMRIDADDHLPRIGRRGHAVGHGVPPRGCGPQAGPGGRTGL